MWSGTLWVAGCRTSTTSAPMTLRSPLSSVVTSTHQEKGEKERKPDISFLLLTIPDTFKYPIKPAITQNPQLGGRVAGQQGLPDGVHVGRAQRSQGHGELPYLHQCCQGHDIFGRKKHFKCNPHILHLSKNKACKNNCLFVTHIKLCNQGA